MSTACPAITQFFAGLSRQGLRWLFAARQDQNPVVRMLHYTYAVRDLEHAWGLVCRHKLSREVEGYDLESALEAARAGQDAVQRWLVQVTANVS